MSTGAGVTNDLTEESNSSSQEITLSKKDIQRLISINSDRITVTPYTSGTSEVWKSFKILNVDNAAVNYVKCNNCAIIIQWTRKIGTGNLLRHIPCGIAKPSVSTAPLQTVQGHFKRVLPESAKSKLNETIVIALASDIRPLYAVEGKGFQMLAQAFIDFGAKHGRQDVKSVIQCRKTLKLSVLPRVVSGIKGSLTDSLKTAPSFPKFSFSLDMWSDKIKKRNFTSLSIHYFDKKFDLKCKLLGVDQFPDQRKTTLNIRKEVERIIGSYFSTEEVALILQEATAVSDGGSNMLKIFQTRQPCHCHRLNLLLQRTFDDTDQILLPEINSTIASVKGLVTFFKQSGLNSKLPITLKQEIATRWNSQLIMLESYSQSAPTIKSVLEERDELDKLDEIDILVVDDLISFLIPFREASQKVSADKTPTFHLVALYYHKLRKHLEIGPDDSPVIVSLKQAALKWFPKYCAIEEIHYAACLLHPWYRKMKFALDKRNAAVTFLRTLMANTMPVTNASITEGDPPAKRVKVSARRTTFADFLDSDNEDNEQDLDELDLYLAFTSVADTEVSSETFLVEFWKNENRFPTLCKIAQWLLAIPASSATDERVFSTTGYTLNHRRSELGGGTLGDLTYIHDNFD